MAISIPTGMYAISMNGLTDNDVYWWRPLDDTCFGCQSGFYELNETQLAVGLGISGAAWLYGILDAPNAVGTFLSASVQAAPQGE